MGRVFRGWARRVYRPCFFAETPTLKKERRIPNAIVLDKPVNVDMPHTTIRLPVHVIITVVPA
jgi:hypothetical protein